jgi:hypothetical protein
MIISAVTVLSSCSFNVGTTSDPGKAVSNSNTSKPAASNTSNAGTSAPPSKPAATPEKASAACREQKLDGKVFIKSQTFPIDFKPYEGSCFVTFAEKEDMVDEKDVPRGSTFYIYKDNKQLAELPDAFGGSTACWIEGVSFKDLNGDGLTDIVLAGSCLGAKASFPSNAVYVNTGSEFQTDDEANSKLENLKSVKEIESFVKSNVKLFF